MSTPLLDVKDLKVTFRKASRLIKAVDGVNITVSKGEVFGIVGESGSGKSVTALSIMRLLDDKADVKGKWIKLEDRDLLGSSEKEMQKVRGDKISMIFQDPMTSLNPSMRIGAQIEESLKVHRGMSAAKATAKVCEMMELVAIPAPEKMQKSYPHEFSGGMRQRVMIAMALCCDPLLLIADEPTTALDVTIQAQILELIRSLVSRLQTSILMITHDFGVIAELCDKVSIMYGGNIVEHAHVKVILEEARHPYTIGLLNCALLPDQEGKKLTMIPGLSPDPANFPLGCKFQPRCTQAKRICSEEIPPLVEVKPGHFVGCFL